MDRRDPTASTRLVEALTRRSWVGFEGGAPYTVTMADEISPFGPLFRRLGRTTYYPTWGDPKHQQAAVSASRRIFQDRDLSTEILTETAHRAQRTANPEAPGQSYAYAQAKVWRRFARAKGADPDEVQALEPVARRYRDRSA